MDYNSAIDYLYGLQKHGIKLGLENTVRLLSLLGRPQDAFKAVHVAGTNGKGSTSAMIASMLRAAGFRVGLFTSPHLVRFTERIKVNDEEIQEHEIIGLTAEIKEIIASKDVCKNPKLINPTFFEFVTAMAFLYFSRKKIDWAVVETGMGGRLDATNVLNPIVSVITRISCDHKEFLGSTLKDIAYEKAGIIKDYVPVVTHSQKPEAMEAISEMASKSKAPLFAYDRDFKAEHKEGAAFGSSFDYQGRNSFAGLYTPLAGKHQIMNASSAIKAMEIIMNGQPDMAECITEGLAKTIWQGRLELIKEAGCTYDMLFDGAHNPEAAETLADAVKDYFAPAYSSLILILGIMADKDAEGIMKPLLPAASEVIFTAPDYERAASPEKLAGLGLAQEVKARTANSVKEAMDLAVKIAEGSRHSKKTLILITGSFYTIGEARAVLLRQDRDSSLSGLR